MEKNYFGAIEFGSLYNNVLVASFNNNKLDIVALAKCKANGFINGEIIDDESFVESIKDIKSLIYSKFKIELDEVIVILPNNEHKIYSAFVSNKVLTERQIIGKNQIDAIRKQIRNAKVSENEVLVDEVPTSYTLDGERVLRSAPINYQSSILAIRSNVHTLPKNIVESIKNALYSANINMISQYLNCQCGAYATANDYELEGECIHINITTDNTTISAFNKNILIKSSNTQFGLNTLVTHLSNELNLSKDVALDLLESFLICNLEYASDVVFNEEFKLSERKISKIILNKLYQGFDEIKIAIDTLIEECKFTENTYLLTGVLNDYEFFVEEFSKHVSLKLNDGNVDVIGIDEQTYVNCYGAIKQYVENNKDLIIRRLENEIEVNFNQSDATIDLKTTTLNKSSSKFKDIFDD